MGDHVLGGARINPGGRSNIGHLPAHCKQLGAKNHVFGGARVNPEGRGNIWYLQAHCIVDNWEGGKELRIGQCPGQPRRKRQCVASPGSL